MDYRQERRIIDRISRMQVPEPKKHFDNVVIMRSLVKPLAPFLKNEVEMEKLVNKNFDIFIAVVQKLSEAVGKAENRADIFSKFWDGLPTFMQRAEKVSNCMDAWEREPYEGITPIPRPISRRKSRRNLNVRYVIGDSVAA